MQIKTSTRGTWIVLAQWFGAERVVFESADLFECIGFEAEANRSGSL